MKSILFSIVLFLTVGLFSVEGQTTYKWPIEKPEASVTFPMVWTVETDGQSSIDANSSDNTISLSLWSLPSKDLQTVLNTLDKEISKTVTLTKKGNPENITNGNGVEFTSVDGEGKLKDGTKVNVSVVLFRPKNKSVFIILYFGTPEGEKEHESELIEFINSIKKA